MARKTGDDWYYYLYNAHGDVIGLTDESGTVVNSYAYSPWGEIRTQTESVTNPIKYAGEYYDDELDMLYLRARYYDPQIGRFISLDAEKGSIQNPMDMNRYVYCRNNPIKYVDPTGMTWEYFDTYLPQWAQTYLQKLTNLYYKVGNTRNETGGFVRDDVHREAVNFRMRFLDSKYLGYAARDLRQVGFSGLEPDYYQRLYEWAIALQETEKLGMTIPRKRNGDMKKSFFNALLGSVKRDIAQVNAASRELGMTNQQRYDFGNYIEDYKAEHGMPRNATLSYGDLLKIGREFLGQ